MEPALEPRDPEELEVKKNSSFLEIVKFAVIAIIIVAPIRMFIAKPFIVSGQSMDPTFQNGEYLIVDQLTYRFEDPSYGDVIIFKYPRDTSKYFIKRVIGQPKDTIEIKNGTIPIYNEKSPEGFALPDEYVKYKSFDNFSIILKDHEYFVMGDNRPESSDSRFWGPLKDSLIVGRPFIRLFPFSKIDLFPGYEENSS